jgi:protocatechuate 3,4-dioxygenase beta subunit
MVSSNRRLFASILIVLAAASFTHAQKDQTASISGKVTLKDKGVAGIVVVLSKTNNRGGFERERHRGTTDDEGTYHINNVPAGHYEIYPIVPALVVEKGGSKQVLVVAAGETIRDINFALVHGGVITGRITDADGQPLIDEAVNVTSVEQEFDFQRPNFTPIQTDDRGIYRAFGLRRGKYRVSIGQSEAGLPGYVRQSYRQTFYPSVTDREKATIVEVDESSEIQNIDIVASAPVSSFKVTGRIIDGGTGKPVPNISFQIQQRDANHSTTSSGATGSNQDGEFKLENAAPGRYTLIATPPEESEWRADPLTFEVVDRDVSGLEIKTRKAASLSGVVVDSSDGKPVTPKRNDLMIFAYVENPSVRYESGKAVQIKPDGSFRIGGLMAGEIRLTLGETGHSTVKEFETVSIEQNGVSQPGVINVKDGEQIAGLRVVVKRPKLTGAIRGQVKFENGEPPPTSRIVVSVRLLDESSGKSQSISSGSPDVDARGHFLVEQLATGTYELRVVIFGARNYDSKSQQVTVTENTVSEVTLTVKVIP